MRTIIRSSLAASTATAALSLVVFFGVATDAHAATLKATPLEISGWIPYWRAATGTADAIQHLDTFKEINPFVYTMKSDGTVFDAGHMDQEPWLSLVAAAKAKKVRVIPTIMWSDGETIHRILSNQTTRIALEDEITALVKAKGYDGIDIDFEGKLAETKPYFSTFLRGLYQRMGNKWVMCTIEARTPLDSRFTVIPKDIQFANDYKEINKYCDRVRIMAYDQGTIDLKLNETEVGPYIPVADPLWVEKVMLLASKDIAKKKLVIGIPTYGYEYDLVPMREDGFSYNRQWAFNPRYATELAASQGITPMRNSAGELSFIYFPTPTSPIPTTDSGFATDTNPTPNVVPLGVESPAAVVSAQVVANMPTMRILWWSDANAISQKVALARKLGLRGVAIFKIDGGEDPLMWNVLK